VLDFPDKMEPSQLASWIAALGLSSIVLPFGAIYYPWLFAPVQDMNTGLTLRIPPCGYVAGAYAQTDLSIGVQKPPANIELQFAVQIARLLNNDQQGQLNNQGINVIRLFPGRGIRIWGARSLAGSGDDDTQPNWRFIHTRRVMSMIEDSIEKSMQWTTFQSNDTSLRSTLTHSLNVFLQGLWQTGGFLGTSYNQAFFVKCDDTNNPQPIVDEGQLICQIGVAVAAPMEFLTFQIVRTPDATDVVEA
jgi:phage tail sheath protein FI